jgi:uncharacterized protein YjbI with pentapeptide repeats
MAKMKSLPVELFYSYSHRDWRLREQLEKHLSILKYQSVVSGWYDRKISAGNEWRGQIDEHLDKAGIILLLISSDFLASEYCYDIEMKRAMRRHEQREALVVPVILRDCLWKESPFGKLQALPKDGKPVIKWASRDEAFTDVALGIQTALKNLAAIPTTKKHASFRSSSVAKRSNNKKVEWILTFFGTPELIDENRTQAIVAQLRELTGDPKLTVKEVKSGSIKITFKGSSESFRKIQELFDKGKLTNLDDLQIKAIQLALNKSKPLKPQTQIYKRVFGILRRGCDKWNEWRHVISNEQSIAPLRLIGADLRSTDLRGFDLSVMDLTNADLSGADLRKADLSNSLMPGADLSNADMRDANLGEALLFQASLKGANLSQASLQETNLTQANLESANLTGANLIGATLLDGDISNALIGSTVFANIDLSTIRGLDTVKHIGPSHIAVDTFFRSNGKIPESFLRGAGVPDNFIESMHSLTGEAIQFYSCFISYSSKDQEFAERLHTDLQAKGVRCWFAPQDMKFGKKIYEAIDQAIRIYDKLLLIISEDSMRSRWVSTEISHARQRELQENQHLLFPVSLVPFIEIQNWESFDADSGKDMAREIREYYIPDFSNWKDHDSYQKAFDQLTRDLKAEKAAVVD